MKPDGEFQNIIAGSGPGGAVAASMLAAQGQSTAVLEAGLDWAKLPPPVPFSFDEIQKKYRQRGMTVALGTPKVAYAEGCCLGGGSEVNSGLFHRCPEALFAEWHKRYQLKPTPEDIWEHIYAGIEKELSVQCHPDGLPGAARMLRDGAESLGWQGLEVPRWVRYSSDASGATVEVRQTMSKTFLRQAAEAGCQFVTGTSVRRIERAGSHWLLHCHQRDGSFCREKVYRTENLFLACGATQTPFLLRRSGLALGKLSPLHLHPTIKVIAKFPGEINGPEMGVPSYQVKEHAPDYSFGCSISTPQHLALNLLDHPEALRSMEGDGWRRHAIYYAMTTGGKGRVLDPRLGDKPLVTYALDHPELALMNRAARDLMRLLLAAGAEYVVPTVRGAPIVRTEEELAALPEAFPAADMNLMTIHLFSSARMGEDSAAVTDTYGQLRGQENLWVADASLLCGPPSVNPQGSIMAIVKRNLLHHLGQL